LSRALEWRFVARNQPVAIKKRAPAIAPIAMPILAPVEREEELGIVG
jgi:hypothetical protein